MTSSRVLAYSVGALMAVASLSTGCAHPRPGYHHGASKSPAAQPSLRVVGRGTVEVPPDVARIRFGVMERGATANEASDAVQRKMQAVIAAIKAAGVPREQIQTDQLNLRENHEYRFRRMQALEEGKEPGDSKGKPAPDRYIARHTVQLELSKLSSVGSVLQAVQNAGVNEIDDVAFELKDPAAALAQAREKAIEDGQAQAERIAKHAGVALGKLMYISTSYDDDYSEEGFRGGVVGGVMARAHAASASVEAPVQPGKLEFSQQIYLRYEIAGELAKPSRPAPSQGQAQGPSQGQAPQPQQ